MTDPNSVGITPETWTLIFGGVGTAIAAFAVRMGWKGGGREIENPSDVMELKSAIVDSSSVKLLAASIEGMGFNILEVKRLMGEHEERNAKLAERLIDAIEDHTNEMRQLNREIRDHAREIAKAK